MKLFEELKWKIELFFEVTKMEFKTRKLERAIEKKRRENGEIKKELEELVGEEA